MNEDQTASAGNVSGMDLFKSMTGDSVTKEQFTQWKLLQKQAGDLLESDDEDEEDFITYTDTTLDINDITQEGDFALLDVTQEGQYATQLDISKNEEVMVEQTAADEMAPSTLLTDTLRDEVKKELSIFDLDADITLKYLQGEIQFSEFTEMMERMSAGNIECSLDVAGNVTVASVDFPGGMCERPVSSQSEESTQKGDDTEEDEEEDEHEKDDRDNEEDNEGDEEDEVHMDADDSEWTPENQGKPSSSKKSVKKKIVVKKITPRKFTIKSPKERERKERKKKRKGTDLPKHLQGLMGEAHLKFARGDHDEAVKMCMEVIRLAPKAAEPFQTLGLLYEELGDMQKSVQFSLIAALLRPEDSDEWIRLAEMSSELGEIKQAITCYTKALKYDPGNLACALERCSMWEQLKEHKKALEGYHHVLKILPKEDGQRYFQIARDITKVYHEGGEMEKAVTTLREAFSAHPEQLTSEDVNLLLELQMAQKMFRLSLELLVRHCGVSLYRGDDTKWLGEEEGNEGSEDTSTGVEQLVRCVVSDLLPIDLRVKLVVCLIHVDLLTITERVISPLFEEEPEENGDLYLDVAEAYMDTGHYREARRILHILTKTRNYGLAAVWLRYAECLSVLGDLDGSVSAYGKVVKLAPNHLGARVSLSNLQQLMGKPDEALKTLSKDEGYEDLDTDLTSSERWLLLHKCMMLYSQKRHTEFISNSKTLIMSHLSDGYSTTRSYIKDVMGAHTGRRRAEGLRMLAKSNPEILTISKGDKVVPPGPDKGLSREELWDLVIKVFDVLVEEDRLLELEELAFLTLSCPQFTCDDDMAREVEDLCLLAFMLNKNGQLAYNYIKEMSIREFDNVNAWNLFGQILLNTPDTRQNRFCLRLSLKNPDHLYVGLMNAHNALVAGSYKHSLGEYACALRQAPQDPMINLCVGITFIHLASGKFAAKRHALLTQGCAFLDKYLELRGECQETCYNLGRAMHQLDLKYAAVFYYKKALSLEPAIQDEQGIFDLSKEAAYNLALIYQTSNTPDYARMLLQKYCVI